MKGAHRELERSLTDSQQGNQDFLAIRCQSAEVLPTARKHHGGQYPEVVKSTSFLQPEKTLL